MKRFVLGISSFMLCTSMAFAQTLGSTLDDVREDASGISSRYSSASTWGQQTAVDDLNRLATQSQRLQAALAGQDARSVETLQRGLKTAARRVETSSVLLPDMESSNIEAMLARVSAVDDRLTDLRLRFGGKASLVPGALSEVPLESSSDDVYTNIQDLLIDVRTARELAQSLRASRTSPFGFGFGLGGNATGPNNLDPLRLRRLVRASWNLQRSLQGRVDDVSDSYNAWRKFKREWDRIGYPGGGRVIVRLERVMNRLDRFYSEHDGEFGTAE